MKTPVGIDALCFYTPQHYLRLADLAAARKTSPSKYLEGLGQWQMSVPAPGEDIITMGANACRQLFERVDKEKVRLLIFATESSVDQSKSAGIYLHHLLGIPSNCRVIEVKQACYSATAGLQLALRHVGQFPDETALIVASDIPRYGLGTPGEPSHGAGAVAMAVSTNPRTVRIEEAAGYHTEDHMDFWRPNYRNEAIVAGKLSCELYFRFLQTTWQRYRDQSKRTLCEHAGFCFHVPIPRLVEKALAKLLDHEAASAQTCAMQHQMLQHSLQYSRHIGNCYTASLYLALISLLDHGGDLTEQCLGMYSYGSGSVAEFFSVKPQPAYRSMLFTEAHNAMLSNRRAIDVATYEAYYNYPYPDHGQYFEVQKHPTGAFRLVALDQHKRIYQSDTSA